MLGRDSKEWGLISEAKAVYGTKLEAPESEAIATKGAGTGLGQEGVEREA